MQDTETVTLTREAYDFLVSEVETLRRSDLYMRLLEFEENIKKGLKFTRTDLGF